ncbi:MAG TPA: hypothetical protein VE817_01605 [Candidatus Acidoferrum sp.]|nr:hypothetical protein [Candidatus Acidoferrum sp.]
MFTDLQIIERIEDAQTKSPYCLECGQPTAIAERDNILWLECSSLAHRPSRLQSLLRFDFARFHTQRPVVELSPAA